MRQSQVLHLCAAPDSKQKGVHDSGGGYTGRIPGCEARLCGSFIHTGCALLTSQYHSKHKGSVNQDAQGICVDVDILSCERLLHLQTQ